MEQRGRRFRCVFITDHEILSKNLHWLYYLNAKPLEILSCTSLKRVAAQLSRLIRKLAPHGPHLISDDKLVSPSES